MLPLNMQIKTVLNSVADAMSKELYEKAHLEEQNDCWLLIKEVCAPCYGRTAEKPLCFTTIGGILEGLKWGTGKNFDVTEITCRATGGTTCTFRIAKTPLE
jgi:predicted hydrocarbon binding protein